MASENLMILNSKKPQGKSQGPWKCNSGRRKQTNAWEFFRENWQKALCKLCKSEYTYHGEKPVSREITWYVFTLQSHSHQKSILTLMLIYLKQSDRGSCYEEKRAHCLNGCMWSMSSCHGGRDGLFYELGWVYHVPSATHKINAEVAMRKLPAENY